MRTLSDLTTMAKAIETEIDGAKVLGISRTMTRDIIMGEFDAMKKFQIELMQEKNDVFVITNGQRHKADDAINAITILKTCKS